MKKLTLLMFMALSGFGYLTAQDFKFNVGGYVDAYYATDNDYLKDNVDLDAHLRTMVTDRKFAYANAKKDQFDLNLAQVTGNFTFKDLVRGKITLQHGTLANKAWNALDNNMIQEAYAGFRLCNNLWLDAGIFLTHIGGESYAPKDNWLSSHSIVTFYEPFYHEGVKATWSNDKFTAMLGLYNAYASAADNNKNKTLAAYLAYNINENYSISYGGIYGNESEYANGIEVNEQQKLMLHNICLNGKITPSFEAKAQVDIATKEKCKPQTSVPSLALPGTAGGSTTNYDNGSYLGFSVQCRYTFIEQLRATLRFANTNDEDLVFGSGIKGTDITLGIEYKPLTNAYIRLEGGMLKFDGKNDAGKVFMDSDLKTTDSRTHVALNFGVWID